MKASAWPCTTALERKLAAAASLTMAQYNDVREALAEALDVRVETLDAEVKLLRRGNGKDRARTDDVHPEIPPVEAYLDDAPSEISDTDIANAQRLAARHGQDLRFTPERGWHVWDGRRWAVDDKGVEVQARAKETALSIFDEIKAPDRDARMQHAKRSRGKSAIEENLARALGAGDSGAPHRI